MKLLSCHIENFGKLHDLTMHFEEGVNIICEENGWGKSTFAAFIKAMFYGLDGERKRSVAENERKRYKPWQGGVFGGQITFETQGKRYLVSRIFGEKEAQDSFELRDAKTNLPSDDYTKAIGEEIFQINSDSFLRTIFVGQNACETSPTDDVHAKIGNVGDHMTELGSFESAKARLTELINALNPSRATGSICKRRDEITRLERLVRDGEGIADSIANNQTILANEEEKYENTRQRMQEAVRRQEEIAKLRAIADKQENRKRLMKIVAARRKERDAAAEKFPGQIPQADAVREQLESSSRLASAKERYILYDLSEEEKQELAICEEMFAPAVATAEQIEEALQKEDELQGLRGRIATMQMSEAEQTRLEQLRALFAKDADSVDVFTARWNERNTKKSALVSKQAACAALRASLNASQKPAGMPGILLSGISMLFFVVGLYLLWGGEKSGIALLAAGCVLLLIGVLTYTRKKAQHVEAPELAELVRSIEEDDAWIAAVDHEVADYLRAHGKEFDEMTVSATLMELTRSYMEYQTLAKKEMSQRENDLQKKAEELDAQLEAFLAQYKVQKSGDRYYEAIHQIAHKVQRFTELKEKRQKSAQADSICRELSSKIDAFFTKHEITPEEDKMRQLARIRDELDDYLDAGKLCREAETELSAFEEELDDEVFGEEIATSDLPLAEEIGGEVLALTGELEEIRRGIVSVQKLLETLREQSDTWEENRDKLEQLREVQKLEETKYKRLGKARKYLETAKENMTAKYTKPIRDSFAKYYEMIALRPADDFYMDANTSLTLAQLGKQRQIDTLSAGYKDLIHVCLRTALADAMYQGEVPMLILDDPFTNLDDEKRNAGKNFLEYIAGKYQVIYFTCSRDRC
ncbi:MAG: AAA family ATPase [Lachnospiraceae bacterium]|nr:AAA family ATPase [Lachnospiraceae bacterium]